MPLSNPGVIVPKPCLFPYKIWSTKYLPSYKSQCTNDQILDAVDVADFAAKVHCLGHPGASLESHIAERRIYQTKKSDAFARADKLLGDLEAHPATKRVSCDKIGSLRLHSSNFGDAIGSHRLNCACNAVLAIQRRPLQSVNRSVALEIANQMAVAQCEAGSVVHKEKRKTCAGGTQRQQ